MRLLGLDSRSTFHNWKRGDVAALSKDALERISYVMGIYKGLQILVPQTADEWVRKPNKAKSFAGKSALDRMVSGYVSDHYVVRQYIDGQPDYTPAARNSGGSVELEAPTPLHPSHPPPH